MLISEGTSNVRFLILVVNKFLDLSLFFLSIKLHPGNGKCLAELKELDFAALQRAARVRS